MVNPGGNLFSFQGGTFNRTDTFQYAGGMRFNQNRLHINIDVARTTSTFTGSTESLDRILGGPRTVTFNNEIPAFTVTGINFLDPTAQTFQGLFEENQRSAGQDWQIRGDIQYDFDSPFLRNIQVGTRYTDRDAQRNYSNRYGFLLPLGLNASTLPVDFDVFRGVDRANRTFHWAAPTYDSIRDNLAAAAPVRDRPLRGDPGDRSRQWLPALYLDGADRRGGPVHRARDDLGRLWPAQPRQ